MRWLRSQFRTFETLFVWWRDNLTIGGKTITSTLLLCLPALAMLDSPLFLLFSAQLSLLLVNGAVSYWFRPRLMVRVLAPASVACHEPVELVVYLANQSSQPARDLSLQLDDGPASWEMPRLARSIALLDGGESLKVPITIRPRRRGPFELPAARVSSTFPLSLFRLGRVYPQKGEVMVLPSYRPLAALDLSRMAAKFAGELLHNVVVQGHGGDYFGSREYLPGMAVRRWDYSSWARLGQPIVREFSDPQAPCAAIVIDTCFAPRVPRPDDEELPELEATVSLAAALSDALTRQNYRVGLLAIEGQVHDLSTIAPADQHEFVVRSLAVATAVSADCFAGLRSELELTPLAPAAAFVLLSGWDDTREGLCQDLLHRGCEVTRIFIGERVVEADAAPWPGDVLASVEQIETGGVEIR
jgi:uncharacterized protein (DUF58 family)